MDRGVKQRRFTDAQLACVGGITLLLRYWKSLTVGTGIGSLLTAAPPAAAAGAIVSAVAAPNASTASDLAPCLTRVNPERTIFASIVAGGVAPLAAES